MSDSNCNIKNIHSGIFTVNKEFGFDFEFDFKFDLDLLFTALYCTCKHYSGEVRVEMLKFRFKCCTNQCHMQ